MTQRVKKILLFLSLFVIVFSIFSCQAKNPFYGLDEEDKIGPDISVDYPLEGSTVTSTFNLIGTAKDKGGDNTVLKIEISLDNGASWYMAGGTTNWSYTVDPLFAWGILAGDARTIKIKATDTDYKKNTTIKTISYVVNNTNPDLFGSIVDVNDNIDFDGIAQKDGYHQTSETKIIRFNWQHEPGAEGYDVALYNVTDGKSDLFSKDIPNPDNEIAYDSADINSGGALTTGVSNIRYEKNGDQIYFKFEGVDGKQYFVAVKPYDNAGQRGAAKLSVSQTIDTIKPGNPLNFKVNGKLEADSNKNFNSKTVTFSWDKATDAHTDIRYYKIDVDNNGTVDLTIPGDSSNFTYTYDSDGTYTARIRSVDMAGNWSGIDWTESGTFVTGFTINTGIPADVGTITIPSDGGNGYQNATETNTITYSWADLSGIAGYDIQIINTKDGTFDLYSPSSVGLTATWGPVFAGLGDSGASNIEIRKNGSNIEFQFNGTEGATYQLQAKAYNNAGTRSANWKTAPRNVMIDTTLPSTPSLTLINGKSAVTNNYSNTTANLFSWSVATDSASGIAYYQISTNGGSSVNGANETGTSANRTLAVGSYDIKVRAIDKAGNIGNWSSPTINLTINIAGPGAPTNIKVAGLTGPLYYNSAQTPSISWTAPGVVGSGLAYYQISLDNGASVNGANITVPTTSASRSLALKSNGDYQVCVRAVDNSGNIGPWSSVVSVFVENNLPGTPTNLQVAGSTGPLYYNSAQTRAITWTNPNDGSGSGIAYYQISLDNGSTVAGVITNGGNYPLPLQASVYNVKVRAVDNSGNNSLWSSAVSVFVENDAPTNPTNFKINGSGATPQYGSSAGTFALSWDSSTDSTGSGVEKYRIYNGGTLVQDNITGNNYSLSLTLGTHTLSVRAVDRSGNESVDSDIIHLILENTLPTFTAINTPSINTYEKSTVEFTDFNGADTNFKNYEYIIIENGLPFSFGSTGIGITNPVVSVASPNPGKTYALMARAIDLAGNASAWVTSKIITYDTVAPNPPSISNFVDVGGNDGVSQATVEWIAVTDSLSGLASYDLEVSDGTYTAVINISVDSSGNLTGPTIVSDPDNIINTVTLTTPASPNFTITLTFNYTADTNVTVKIRATDKAGNHTVYDAGASDTIIF